MDRHRQQHAKTSKQKGSLSRPALDVLIQQHHIRWHHRYGAVPVEAPQPRDKSSGMRKGTGSSGSNSGQGGPPGFFSAGEELTCRIVAPEPQGYSVIVQKGSY